MLATSLSTEVQELVARHMESGKYESESELIRAALKTLAQSDADMEAIREGIADMEAGRTQPIDVVFTEICREHGFGVK